MDGYDYSAVTTALVSDAIACNSKYAAHVNGDGLHIRALADAGIGSPRKLFKECTTRTTPVLAFSPARTNHLAVSHKGHVIIYDIETCKQLYAAPGNGRVITSLAWSPLDPETLAVGCINGTIRICSVRNLFNRVQQLVHLESSCSYLSFSPHAKGVIASAHDGTIAVWSLDRPSKPIKSINLGCGSIRSLAWHPTLSGRLLGISSDNIARVWDLTEVMSTAPVGAAGDELSDDEGVFGPPDDLQRLTYPIVEVRTATLITTAGWIGEHGVFVHSHRFVHFYSFGTDWEMPHEVWHLDLGSTLR